MVKQRFLTHFKPWLFAVCKAGGADCGVSSSSIRFAHGFQYPPLNISDVVMAATSRSLCARIALCMLGMGRVVLVQNAQVSWVLSELKRAFNDRRRPRTVGPSRPVRNV